MIYHLMYSESSVREKFNVHSIHQNSYHLTFAERKCKFDLKNEWDIINVSDSIARTYTSRCFYCLEAVITAAGGRYCNITACSVDVFIVIQFIKIKCAIHFEFLPMTFFCYHSNDHVTFRLNTNWFFCV